MNVLKRFRVDESARKVYDVAGPHLPRDCLDLLFAHQVGAVLVRNFYGNEALRQEVIGEIERTNRVSNWKVSQADGKLVDSEVNTIGMPLNVAKGLGRVDEYFDSALASGRQFRVEGRMSPIDKVRLELDEIYPYGCVLGRDPTTRRAHASGLVRIMKRNGNRGLVHLDDVSVFSPQSGVFSANVYLQQSVVGGEIEIWPVTLTSEAEMHEYALEIGLLTSQAASPDAQRALREYVLPPNPTIVKPNAGDLLLLCVQRPHCVKGPLHGPKPRYNFQTFIVHNGGREPLQVEV